MVSPLCCSPSCGGGEEKLVRELEEPSKLLSAKTAVFSALQETASSPVDIPESSIAIELLQHLSVCIQQCCLRFIDNGSVLCGMHYRVGHREGGGFTEGCLTAVSDDVSFDAATRASKAYIRVIVYCSFLLSCVSTR